MSESWMSQALCSQTDPEVFFPPDSGTARSRDAWKAKRICSECPVQPQCAEYALSSENHAYGIWGGLTEQERRVLRRRRGRSGYVALAFYLYEDQPHEAGNPRGGGRQVSA